MDPPIYGIIKDVRQWLELTNLIYSSVNLIFIYNLAYYALYKHLSHDLGFSGFKKKMVIKFIWFLIICVVVEIGFCFVPINKKRESCQLFQTEWIVIVISDFCKLVMIVFMQGFSYLFLPNENNSRLETTQNTTSDSLRNFLSSSMRRACRFTLEIALKEKFIEKKYQYQLKIEYDINDSLIREKTSIGRQTTLKFNPKDSTQGLEFESQQMKRKTIYKTLEELTDLAQKLQKIQEKSLKEDFTELFSGRMNDLDLRLLMKYINRVMNIDSSEIKLDENLNQMIVNIFEFLGFNPKSTQAFIPNLFLPFDFPNDFRVSVEKMETLFQHYVVTDIRKNFQFTNSFTIYATEMSNNSKIFVTRTRDEISEIFSSIFSKAVFPMKINLEEHKLQIMYTISILLNEHSDKDLIQDFLDRPNPRLPDVALSISDFYLETRPMITQYEEICGYEITLFLRGSQKTISRTLNHFRIICNHLEMRFGEIYKWDSSNFNNPRKFNIFINSLISEPKVWRCIEFMLFMDHIPEDITNSGRPIHNLI